MPFPTAGWPPRPSSNTRSIRFFVRGVGTANWADNAYLFIDGVGANTYTPTPIVQAGSSGPGTTTTVGDRTQSGSPMGAGPGSPGDVQPGSVVAQVKPQIYSGSIRVCNDGAAELEISFAAPDNASTLVQGVLKAGEVVLYRNRYEAGIAVRGVTAFRIEAW